MKKPPNIRRETIPIDQIEGQHLTIDDASAELSGHKETAKVLHELQRREREESQREVEARVKPEAPSPIPHRRRTPQDRKRRDEIFREQLRDCVASAEQGLARLLLLAQDTRATDKEGDLAGEAAEAMMNVLIRFVDDVRVGMIEGTPAFSAILSKSLRWPIIVTPFPRDRAVIERELRDRKFGLEAPLNGCSTGKKDAPGTAWAKQFYFVVQRVQRANVQGALDQMRSDQPGSSELLEEICALPSLRDEPTVIDAWHRVLIAWLEHHHPGYRFHPDWGKTRGGEARIRERLKDGLRQICRQE